MSRSSDARFLIVGASGFIGRHLLAHMRSLGYQAVGTQAHSQAPGLIAFDLLKDRIADRIACSQPTHVIISAAMSDMDRCFAEKETSYRINVENTIQLIQDVRELKAQPVFFSTNFVFDGREGNYTDDHPYSPANEYGRQKAEVEQYIRAHAPEAFVARLCSNVGDTLHEQHLFSRWYKLVTAGEPIVCIDGSLISPTYVEDVGRAIVLGCERGLTGAYNVANEESFYRHELARQFCLALGKSPEVIRKPLKDFGFLDNRALKSNLNSAKFIKATGMKFTPMREVMQNFIRRLPAT